MNIIPSNIYHVLYKSNDLTICKRIKYICNDMRYIYLWEICKNKVVCFKF